ncbi:MAG: polysaccharide biosynthesis protein [Longimicrobiaceae bacterium]
MSVPSLVFKLRRLFVLLLHVAVIPAAYYLAFALRFDGVIPREYVHYYSRTFLYLLALRMCAFGFAGLFQGWWRHVGMSDLVALIKAVTASSVLLVVVLYMTGELAGYPRSVVVLDWACALLLFGGGRFAVRAFREERLVPWPWRSRRGTRALIIGGGAAAERLLREAQRDRESEICPVGIVDDDATKVGMRLHGVPVRGGTERIGELTARFGVKLLVIAIPSATREQMRAILAACLTAGVEFKIVPSIRELLDGRARMGQLRSVQIDDLLGREAVDLGYDGPRADLEGRTVLVTGGAGSIGSELARQVAAFKPARLIVLDQAESPLYFVHLELTQAQPGLPVIPVVADVADPGRMERVFARYRPDFVFHAAAYKHVPLMEHNVVEAVRNNVLGTLLVAECAARFGAEKFVLISTDKAVYPSSVMGATKRIAEQVVLGWPALARARTDFRAVRFGNVLGSDGSVIPLFKRQLAAGLPLTVTHPEVTRYFMTIPEAVQLVLQAAALPDAAGRISMLEMGEPVRILDLAENLIRLSGLEPDKDVPIVFTGLRPGEKLHEELMSEREATVPTAIPKIRVVQTDGPDAQTLTTGLDRLAAAAAVGDLQDALVALCALVPECVAPLRERAGQQPAPERA